MQSKNTKTFWLTDIHHMHTDAGSLQTIFNMTAFVTCGILVLWTQLSKDNNEKKKYINATRQFYKSSNAITKKIEFG